MVSIDVGRWLDGIDAALADGATADVPCGDCTACCTSHQFVLVEPDEAETLARIPSELLFAAPRRPTGHLLLGYDERGHCPMLHDGRCSIYEHRPRTCRTYDCRVLAAAEVDVAADGKPAIAEAVARWAFAARTETDAAELEAVRRAARYLERRVDDLPAELRPVTATQVAVTSVRLRGAFADADAEPDPGDLGDVSSASGG